MGVIGRSAEVKRPTMFVGYVISTSCGDSDDIQLREEDVDTAR
jgi:hypothetical protein